MEASGCQGGSFNKAMRELNPAVAAELEKLQDCSSSGMWVANLHRRK